MRALERERLRFANGSRGVCRVPPSAQWGFSFIELLVVLALMVVLTVMMWGFTSPSHQRAAEKACQANLQKIYLALQIYANDFGGQFPDVTNAHSSEAALAGLVPRYTADTSIFICPGSKDAPLPEGQSFLHRTISYAYYMGWRKADPRGPLMSDWQVNTALKQQGDIVFSTTGNPPGNNHYKYGGNFLFGDGHTEFTPPRLAFPLSVPQGVVQLSPKP